MRLERLQVQDFRNIVSADLTLSPGINVLWGANAEGKTNLLEAVHFLVTGRSFRARRERECIRWGDSSERTALVRGRVIRSNGSHTLQIGVQSSRRRVEIDGAPIAKLAALWGRLNAVLFTPDDLQIVKGPPAGRRALLDIAISQIRPSYLAWLQRYQGALRERTALVRLISMGNRRVDELDAWDAALAEAATEIHAHRSATVMRLDALARETHREVSGETESLRLVYRAAFAADEPLSREECFETYLELLAEARHTDIERGQTTVGPHRDDLAIHLDDTDARAFGSQGQQRAIVLAIRLAEMAIMEEEVGEPPLLLLDDIISELDPIRRRRFFGLLRPEVQSLVTTVEDPEMLEGIPLGQIFAVNAGEYSPVRQKDAMTA